MLLFAVLGSAAFTFVNAFGAWVTQYRRRWIAGLFLAAAFVLAVAVVALLYRTRIALWPLGLGLLLTVTGSLFHALFVTAHGTVNRSRSAARSEEHTSELQSRGHLVCRLLLEKKKEFLNTL